MVIIVRTFFSRRLSFIFNPILPFFRNSSWFGQASRGVVYLLPISFFAFLRNLFNSFVSTPASSSLSLVWYSLLLTPAHRVSALISCLCTNFTVVPSPTPPLTAFYWALCLLVYFQYTSTGVFFAYVSNAYFRHLFFGYGCSFWLGRPHFETRHYDFPDPDFVGIS